MMRYVKDINDFYRTYGKGDFYVNSHHLTLNQLPKELQERGQGAINLAERIVKGGFSKPDQRLIDKTHSEVEAMSKDEHYVIKKIGST